MENGIFTKVSYFKVESYNRQLRELEEQSKARSRHLQSLVSSHVTNTASTHAQFPSHHHLQSDLLLEVSDHQSKYFVINEKYFIQTASKIFEA